TLPADGVYHVVVSAPADHAGNVGSYTMGIADATVRTQALTINLNSYGQLYTSYEIDKWTFPALANEQVGFKLLNESNPRILFDLTGPGGYTAFINSNSGSILATLPAT